MKRAKLRLSDAAVSDILEQADWYNHRSGQILGKRWESAVTSALLRIVRNPRSGSPCTFEADELRSIRRMPIARFPKHLIFYKVEDREVVILRVIHGARDLENLL
ncbi:MAG TPA: type II toxin-antitoxin system RelE/ParE family toxin [Candidatus Sulfotelmatobacter sp.]|nr:type II toxin-antitoxin system RelE/ParE family toxin [Candidatus Sulfotelmatobacter sp.]